MRPPRRHPSRQQPTSSSEPRRSARLARHLPGMQPERYLHEDMTDIILSHIRPDDPAGLAKACAASKNWCRYICSPEFRANYRKLHPKPPLLGFLGNKGRRAVSTGFVLTSTFHLKPRSVPRHYNALHARHGRVIFHDGASLVIWDPMTGKKDVACMPMDEPIVRHWNVALLCGAHGCTDDNITCHGADSVVVFVGTSHHLMQTFVGKYSTELDEWYEPTHIEHPYAIVDRGPSVVLGDKVYFPCTLRTKILEFDNQKDELQVIDAPAFMGQRTRGNILIKARDGVLGFAGLVKSKLHLWSREAIGPGTASTWTQYKVLDLTTMPRIPRLLGSTDGYVFVKTSAGVFIIKLDSGNSEKVSKSTRINKVIPYTAFCTPSADRLTLQVA